MEGEFKNFIKVWIMVLVSLIYCYFISKKIPKGLFRLISIIPIIFIFTILPLSLSSLHLSGTTGFFISWLANFKLLLFSFNKGPLSSNPSISLLLFITISCLPIKIKQEIQNPSSKSKTKQNPDSQITNSSKNQENFKINHINKPPKSTLYYAIEGLLLGLLFCVYEYKQYLHPNLILCIYSLHIYFILEIQLALVSFSVRFLFGLELEPQFNDPYLSTSLQDFWGGRWNLMVTSILRSTIYEPIRPICTRTFGTRWGLFFALILTFVVSGLMHELIFFYLGRSKPNWDVMLFFVLHGVCLGLEVELKKKSMVKGWPQLPRVVSGLLTTYFVVITGFYLFLPVFIRLNADVRSNEEVLQLLEFVTSVFKNNFKFV